MRHTNTTLITLAAVALLWGCLESEERPLSGKSHAVSRCDETGACAAGDRCVEGLCREACAADVDCGDGICLDGLCWAEASGDCGADAECGPGEVCIDGTCALDAEALDCTADDDCPEESLCVSGLCTYAGECLPTVEICDGLDNDCDGLVDEDCDLDLDGDGFAVPEDCDDLNAAVFPGAHEECDDLDNDCDGEVDEDCVILPCEDLEGCLGLPCTADDDCAPSLLCIDGFCALDPACTPEVEVCDGLDNDCDGLVDEGCESGPDLDGDGFSAPMDCDDLDPSINPAAPEECDGVDNDCDGMVDEVCDSGSGAGCGADVECPAGMACVDGVCVDPAGCTPEAEICDGLDNDCDGMVDEGC